MAAASVARSGPCSTKSCSGSGRARRLSNGTRISRPSLSFSTRRRVPTAPLPKRIRAMLPSLRDTQAAFAAHLAGNDRPDLFNPIAGDRRTVLGRLQLHRHHIVSSIGAALAATFPTVAALVGQEFFGLLPPDFAAGTAIQDPVPSRYGEHLFRF